MTRFARWVALLSLFSGSAFAGDCESLASRRFEGFDVVVTRAEQLPASQSEAGIALPGRCRLEGALERRIGVDGKPYEIGFAMLLPDQWNGRFLFQGGGGLNGVIHEPLGSRFAGDRPAISRGFAVVSTDSGHQAAKPFDSSFFADQQALLNFLYRGNERVTLLAKRVLEYYYGREDYTSYFVGCSTGGREAMIMSQRYPAFFDGVVSGAPAMRTNFSELGDAWAAVHLRERKQDGASGEPLLSAAERQTVVDGVLAACDGLDGVEDQLIFNTAACAFDPAGLICTGEKSDSCLTRVQAEGVASAFSGAVDSRGYPIYTPFLYDGGIADGGPGIRMVPGLLHAVAGPLGQQYLDGPVDWDREAVEALDFPLGFGNTSEFENLTTFKERGGRLLFYHGVADPWFSALDTVRYYENLVAESGGAAQTSLWSRLFLSPGVSHCAGGSKALDRVDLLTAIVDWVEKDRAPERVEASGTAFPGRTRPLCPYPSYAKYRRGNRELSASFNCEAP